MNRFRSLCAPSSSGLLALALLAGASTLNAQVVLVPSTPQIGSSNPATAEPPVARPAGTPCTVQLFSALEFADFSDKTFSYTPTCAGPWAKVVFTADFTVTEGRQYDRTADFFLGGTNIYFGTTAEPRAALSPSWHVERDLTDLSAMLTSAQTGNATLGNFVGTSGGVVYNGIIYANAALTFYPASAKSPAPKVPDAVLPLAANGNTTAVNTTTDQLKQTFTLPTNIEAAYLDVISQSQSSDEFWYTCAPSDVASEVENCGSTAFRETEISIDGKPAGLAPVYPWIYTGGIDPYLWEPVTGVETLDFKPYRVDLTPFAGVLSDGTPHTIGVSVYNADSYFVEAATLLLYLDHGTKQVTGGITTDTLSAAPTPYVKENLNVDKSGDVSGNVLVTSQRFFTVSGYVNTSHGRVDTSLNETADFGNYQTYIVSGTQYTQDLLQATGVYAVKKTKEGPFVQETDTSYYYPLTLVYDDEVNADGSQSVVSKVTQQKTTSEQDKLFGFTYATKNASDSVNTTDTLNYSAAGAFTGHDNNSATGTYQSNDSAGHCYSRTITSAGVAITGVTDGAACGGTNKP